MEQYLIRARKLNCSLVYLSQSYFAVPKIKRLNTLQDLFRMMREYSLGVSKDVLVDLYQHSIQDSKQDFLLVDLDSEPKDRFRFNFLDVYDLNGIERKDT